MQVGGHGFDQEVRQIGRSSLKRAVVGSMLSTLLAGSAVAEPARGERPSTPMQERLCEEGDHPFACSPGEIGLRFGHVTNKEERGVEDAKEAELGCGLGCRRV